MIKPLLSKLYIGISLNRKKLYLPLKVKLQNGQKALKSKTINTKEKDI